MGWSFQPTHPPCFTGRCRFGVYGDHLRDRWSADCAPLPAIECVKDSRHLIGIFLYRGDVIAACFGGVGRLGGREGAACAIFISCDDCRLLVVSSVGRSPEAVQYSTHDLGLIVWLSGGCPIGVRSQIRFKVLLNQCQNTLGRGLRYPYFGLRELRLERRQYKCLASADESSSSMAI